MMNDRVNKHMQFISVVTSKESVLEQKGARHNTFPAAVTLEPSIGAIQSPAWV